MKYLTLLFAALVLSACSMQEMVEKTVPENVRADHAAHVNRLLAKDTSRIQAAFKIDAANAELAKILASVPDGNEIRRDYVGLNSASSVSTSEGKSRNISLTTEVESEGGFMLVVTDYALNDAGECCALTNINVSGSDTSPMRATLEFMKKVFKIVGLVLLFGMLGLIALLVTLKRRKRKAVA